MSRGGCPDLAGVALSHVTAPTLLIVGSEGHGVIELHQEAYALLRSEKQLVIILGATHLLEEPGTLEEVARLASQWFILYLSQTGLRGSCRLRDFALSAMLYDDDAGTEVLSLGSAVVASPFSLNVETHHRQLI